MNIVVALGGNALLRRKDEPNISVQFKNAEKAMQALVHLFKKKNKIVLTHGNGPQVGNILIRAEEALGKAYSLPLSVCVAESEGEIGYVLEQSLINILNKNKLKRKVVGMITQVLVSKKDPMLKKHTKPIGPFYTKKQAGILRKKGLHVKEDSKRGWRRFVPSPRPLKILEADIVKKVMDTGVIVIAAGGGGIPVYEFRGRLKGINAVIDKDLASSCLAKDVNAEILLILTDVPCVYLNYREKNQQAISKMNVDEAMHYLMETHFYEGSMKPKIHAAIDFLKAHPKSKVIITNPQNAAKAIKGNAGTFVIR